MLGREEAALKAWDAAKAIYIADPTPAHAQDVTDEMMDTLQATDMGGDKVLITMEAGREEPTKIELTIKKMGKTLKIVSLK